jgi:hypothetical protein
LFYFAATVAVFFFAFVFVVIFSHRRFPNLGAAATTGAVGKQAGAIRTGSRRG